MAKLDTEVLTAPNPEKEFLQAQRIVTYLKALEKEGFKASDFRSYSPVLEVENQTTRNVPCTFPPKIAVLTSGRVITKSIAVLPGVVSLRCLLYSEFIANVSEFTKTIKLIRPHEFLPNDRITINGKTFTVASTTTTELILNEAALIGAYMPFAQLLTERVSLLIF